MSAQLPPIIWPTELQEAGPVGDPSILLIGDANIAGTEYVIAAIRVNQYRTGPDYRDSVSQWRYEKKIARAADMLEVLMDSTELTLQSFEGGAYLLWMMPADEE